MGMACPSCAPRGTQSLPFFACATATGISLTTSAPASPCWPPPALRMPHLLVSAVDLRNVRHGGRVKLIAALTLVSRHHIAEAHSGALLHLVEASGQLALHQGEASRQIHVLDGHFLSGAAGAFEAVRDGRMLY